MKSFQDTLATAILAAALLAMVFSPTGCGKSNVAAAPTPVTASTQTVPQILQQLEAKGALPTLDVTTSIAGSDVNGNGVRDDIDSFIAALPDTVTQKKALTQLAAGIQSTMVIDTTSNSALSSTSMALNRGTACIFQVYPSNSSPSRAALMEELSVNTPARLHAYQLYNYARNGSTSAMVTGSICN